MIKSPILKTIPGTVLFAIFSLCSAFAASQFEEVQRVEKELERQQTVITRPAVRYEAGDKKDPFRVVIKKEGEVRAVDQEAVVEPPKLVIQGIVWGGVVPQAIINEKVVKVGDAIENAHIIGIDKNGVDIFFSGRQFNLPAPALANAPLQDLSPKGGKHDEEKF